MAVKLTRPGGRIANIGLHGGPATLHLEDQWLRDMTVTTGLVDTFSIPALLRLVSGGQLDAARLVSHRFALAEFEHAYDVFAAPADTGALKVMIDVS
jgi:alcohol dehydrogenase